MKLRLACLFIVVLACVGYGDEFTTRNYVGLKLWNVQRGEGEGLLLGPTWTTVFPNGVFFSGVLTYGEVDYDWGSKEAALDADFIVGKRLLNIDLGGGIKTVSGEMRYGGWTSESYTSFGPMLYIGSQGRFGESPFGWFAGGSVVLATFGDLDDQNAYLSLEGGLYFSNGPFAYMIGVRSVGGSDDRSGFTGRISWSF